MAIEIPPPAGGRPAGGPRRGSSSFGLGREDVPPFRQPATGGF